MLPLPGKLHTGRTAGRRIHNHTAEIMFSRFFVIIMAEGPLHADDFSFIFIRFFQHVVNLGVHHGFIHPAEIVIHLLISGMQIIHIMPGSFLFQFLHLLGGDGPISALFILYAGRLSACFIAGIFLFIRRFFSGIHIPILTVCFRLFLLQHRIHAVLFRRNETARLFIVAASSATTH